MNLPTIMTLLETITTDENLDKLKDFITGGNANIVKISKQLVISPPIVVSPTLRRHELITPAMTTTLQIFTSFYSQAFTVLAKVTSIKMTRRIVTNLKTGMESDIDSFTTEYGFLKTPSLEDSNIHTKLPKSFDTMGYMVTMDLDVGKRTVTLPILIKPSILYFDPVELAKTITGGHTGSVFERYHEWRSGGIGFWDYMLGLDIIKNYYKLRIKNQDPIIDRYLKAALRKTSVETNKSLNTIYITTKQEADRIGRLFGGKISKRAIRDRFFDSTSSIFLAYLDDDWEEMVVYIDDFDGETHITYRSIKNQGKDNKETELIKLFSDIVLGRPPKL